MKLTVCKWGNSLALRLPNSITKELELCEGTIMEAVLDPPSRTLKLKKASVGGRARKQRKYTEKQLLAGLTPAHFDREEMDAFDRDFPGEFDDK